MNGVWMMTVFFLILQRVYPNISVKTRIYPNKNIFQTLVWLKTHSILTASKSKKIPTTLSDAEKIARKYFHKIGKPEKNRIITFEGAFHGRTLAALFAAKNSKHIDSARCDLIMWG